MYHEKQILGIALVPDGNILKIINASSKGHYPYSALPPGIFLAFAESEFLSETDLDSISQNPDMRVKARRKAERRLAHLARRFRLAVPPILEVLPSRLDFSKPVKVGDSWLLKPDNIEESLLLEIGQKILAIAEIQVYPSPMTEIWPQGGFLLGCGVTPPHVCSFSFRKLNAILYAIEPWDEFLTSSRWKILAYARRLVGRPLRYKRASDDETMLASDSNGCED